MKKAFLIFAAFLILTAVFAGCSKRAAGDPSAATSAAEQQQSTLQAVSGDSAEVTLSLFEDEETETTAPGAAQIDAGTTRAGETRLTAKGEQTTVKAEQTTAKTEQTTATAGQTTAGANEATTKPNAPQQTTTAASGLPSLVSGEKTTASGSALPTTDSGKNRYELPAIPLN